MSSEKPPVVPRKHLLAFILLTTCFAAWGAAHNMTDPLVKVFSRIWSMSNLQGALVQFSFYGAYFCLALPAAILIKRYSYKTGVLTGLGLFIFGALLFYPASLTMTYANFLLALFILAAGLSVLETSCNPYIISLGNESTATQRLNLAQSFNPVGSNIGVFLAAAFILPRVNPATDSERKVLAETDPAALEAIQRDELSAVMGPYVTMAAVLMVFWLAIAFTRMPMVSDASRRIDFFSTLKRLSKNIHYSFGVVAQFFYVAAQICVWTFIIQYATLVLGFTEEQSGWYLQASLILFLTFRFICTALMRVIRPSAMLLVMASLASGFALYAVMVPGLSGLWAIVLISCCMSLMFPTIYGIALQGLGEDTKIGAAGLVMAILGGALFPMLQGYIIDEVSANISYLVPFSCFIVVAAYAIFDLRRIRKAHGS